MEPMEQIWEKIASPDSSGEKVVVYKGDPDLVFLYANGFVDAVKYSLEEWVAAFADSKGKDGTYRLTHAQWMAKKKFRYGGPVHKPFDPYKLKEAEYSPEDFHRLLKEYLVPSTWLKEEAIPKVMKNYEAAGKFKNEKFIVDQAVKEDFAKILRFYPSPLRVLQIDVHGHPQKGKEASPSSAAESIQTSEKGRKAAAQLEALVRSSVPARVTGESAASQTTTTTLKDLLKKKKRPPSGGRV